MTRDQDWLSELLRPILLPRLEVLIPAAMDDVYNAGEALRNLGEQMFAAITPTVDLFKGIYTHIEQSKRIEASGWLPHYTTPFQLIDDDFSEEDIRTVIERYYAQNWDEVEQAFEQHLGESWLDDEAKATFREALACHRLGHYRSVVRTLFPEIERVASLGLYGGSRKHLAEGAKRPSSIVSLPEFAKTLGGLPVGHVLTSEFGFHLYAKLERHVYRRVELPEEIASAVADPVPNRHASLHGIVTYGTMQNSLNALIMADFIFHMIGQIKSLAAIQREDV